MADFTIMTWNIQQFGKNKGSKDDCRYDFILQILQATNKTDLFKNLRLPNDKIPDIFVIVELSDQYGSQNLKNLTEDINGSLPTGTKTKYGYICSASQITSYGNSAKIYNGDKIRSSSERIGFIYNTDLFTPTKTEKEKDSDIFPIYNVTKIENPPPPNKGARPKRKAAEISTVFPGGRPPVIAHFSVNHSGNNNSNNKNPLVILAWHTAPAPITASSQINLIFNDIKDNKTLSSIPNDELTANPFIVTGDLNIDSIKDNKYNNNLATILGNNFNRAIKNEYTHNEKKKLDYIFYNVKHLELITDSNKVDPLDDMVLKILENKTDVERESIITNLKKIGTKDPAIPQPILQAIKDFSKDSNDNKEKTAIMFGKKVSDHYPILAKFKIL